MKEKWHWIEFWTGMGVMLFLVLAVEIAEYRFSWVDRFFDKIEYLLK